MQLDSAFIEHLVFRRCSLTRALMVRVSMHIKNAKPGFCCVCFKKKVGERDSEAFGVPLWSGAALHFCSINVLYRLAWILRCCVAVFGMSGCDPASHKICKNNAITMTVYKVPEVHILVKVSFKRKKNHPV